MEVCARPLCVEAGTKTCSRCHVRRYCSRECQASDWKAHKPVCAARQPRWHERIPRTRVYERFVVSFQLRVEDEYVFGGEMVGTYGEQTGGEPCAPQFMAYVQLAKAKSVLPSDWTDEDDRQLMQLASGAIHSAIEQSDVVTRFGYGEQLVLRALAETIVGPLGQWVDEY
ncbi:hypothetical protein DYB25_002390 [Aphanomyces astaci]|uniref:MYND-type domain-containing protein n=1 Tax=Aphanomyces astaci TaxID=112090 RepID=A0A397FAZ0_APHAT|nr:hypothetical protein AaE_004558 [Aphanomyces astaci]RHY19213.1 hypothetical protein DYB25_002390 [Aphanomyces astaci]RHY41966.1 hypothetical protein DYB38_012906 [Aphanomyces astaci]RHY55742.1 hypothetical protein DYB34_010361 [Aphanomyces astaci]RHZ17602.1 hypothetical protein DYB31_008038 [Aphanomyces astaci]